MIVKCCCRVTIFTQERIVLCVDDESRNRNAGKKLQRTALRIVINSILKTVNGRGKVIVKFYERCNGIYTFNVKLFTKDCLGNNFLLQTFQKPFGVYPVGRT